MVEHLSDEELQRLPRGGHDYRKLYAAYKAAVEHEGSPTVILAKTIKGWTLGTDFEARNATHQIKKMDVDDLKEFRDRLYLDITDEQLEAGDAALLPPRVPLARVRVPDGAPPRARRLPARARRAPEDHDLPHATRSSTSSPRAPARRSRRRRRPRSRVCCARLMKEPESGHRVVPIIPDEARTFGMDALFPEFKIYAPFGQQYEPVDAALMLSYREVGEGPDPRRGDHRGRLDGRRSPRRRPSYATWGQPMIPFFIFYSMFGFQRVGDLIWSFGDQRGRGFLMGATAGRTTLTGEGLQHCDGQSLLYAMAFPNCRAYDPAFAYEVGGHRPRRHPAHVRARPRGLLLLPRALQRELRRSPRCPKVSKTASSRGLYRFRAAPEGEYAHRAQILASGPMVLQALEAQQLLAEHHDVARRRVERAGLEAAARRRARVRALEPAAPGATHRARRTSPSSSAATEGPIVAVTDWVKAVPDGIARFVPQPYVVLGTDGYGFSDIRAALRRHFEVDAAHIVGRGARRAGPDRRRQGRGRRRGDPRATRSTPTAPTRASRNDCSPRRVRIGRRSGSSATSSLVVGVPVVLVVVELVVEVVVIVEFVVVARLRDVRERAGALPEQPVVVSLLELARFTEPACSSFSGHVVTCLGVVTAIMPCPAFAAADRAAARNGWWPNRSRWTRLPDRRHRRRFGRTRGASRAGRRRPA